jgi:hypothetical protein
MATVENSTSFKINSRNHIKKSQKPKKSKQSLQPKVSQTINEINSVDKKNNLLKKSISFVFTVGTVISCVLSISSRVKKINPVFTLLMDRKITLINDSFCSL